MQPDSDAGAVGGTPAPAPAPAPASSYQSKLCNKADVPTELNNLTPEKVYVPSEATMLTFPSSADTLKEASATENNDTLYEAMAALAFPGDISQSNRPLGMRKLVTTWMFSEIPWLKAQLAVLGNDTPTDTDARAYIERAATPGIAGGPIEMAIASVIWGVHIAVYKHFAQNGDDGARLVKQDGTWPCQMPLIDDLKVWPLLNLGEDAKGVYVAFAYKGSALQQSVRAFAEANSQTAVKLLSGLPGSADEVDPADSRFALPSDDEDGDKDAAAAPPLDDDNDLKLVELEDYDTDEEPVGPPPKSRPPWRLEPITAPMVEPRVAEGVGGAIRTPRRPVSGWRVKGDDRTLIGGLREVEQVSRPCSNKEEPHMLVDPPLQYHNFANDGATAESVALEDARIAASTPVDATVAEIDKLCSLSLPRGQQRKRLAPSFFSLRQDVNTVEIVKKDGEYSVVLDGVSQGVIQRQGDKFEEVSYWMPRFKEKKVHVEDPAPGERHEQRALQPVLVTLRLEDYEEPPERCMFEVHQSTVHGGTQIMPPTLIKQEELRPYSVGDTTCNATVAPYPMICTPEPHVTINDYSHVRHAEVVYLTTLDDSVFNNLVAAGKVVKEQAATRMVILRGLATVATGFTTAAGTLTAGGFAGAAAKATALVNIANALAGWPIVVSLFTPAVIMGIANRNKIKMWGWSMRRALGRRSADRDKQAVGVGAAAGVAAAAAAASLPAEWTESLTESAERASYFSQAYQAAVTAPSSMWNWYQRLAEQGAKRHGQTATQVYLRAMQQDYAGYQYAAGAVNQLVEAGGEGYEWVLPVKMGTVAGVAAGVFYRMAMRRVVGAMGDVKFSAADKRKFLDKHQSAMAKGPKQYKIGISELPGVLRRIAETRANGSLVDGTDQTVGLSVIDLEDHGWRTEAALLEWMAMGNGPRAEKGAEAVKPHTITGRYSMQQDAKQAVQLEQNPADLLMTGNTISVVGMDGLTLSNSRTEFTYTIRITERDGTAGPVVHIAAPRMNAIDAGWLAAGYDEDVHRLEEATDCLEMRLRGLTQVIPWMKNHSTLVADTNNGSTVGDVYDKLLGERMRSAEDPLLEQSQMAQAIVDADKKTRLRKNVVDIKTKLLATKNSLLQKLKDSIKEGDKNYDDRVRTIRDMKKKAVDTANNQLQRAQVRLARANTPAAVQEAQRAITDAQNKRAKADTDEVDRLTKAMNLYNKGAADRAKRLSRRRREAQDADHALRVAQSMYNVKRVEALALKGQSDGRPTYAEQYDYEVMIGRLRSDVLGKFTREQVRKRAADEPCRVREVLRKQRRWYESILAPGKTQEAQAQVDRHREWCKDAVCRSLAVPWDHMLDDGIMLLRFMDMYSPPFQESEKRNHASMRMGAFVVPNPEEWNAGAPRRPQQLVRVLPQIVEFPNHTVSVFGASTVLRPQALKPTDEFGDDSMAKGSVLAARKTMTRMTKRFDLSVQRVWHNECHMVQVYRSLPTWDAGAEAAFLGVAQKGVQLLDLLAASALPNHAIALRSIAARDAGGRRLAATEALAAGPRPEGVAHTLSQMGVAADTAGLLAMATFAELLAFSTLTHGGYGANGGFGLQRVELMHSGLRQASKIAATIVSVLDRHYTDPKIRPYRLAENDTAFYCMPDMTFVQKAMLRLGLLNYQRVWSTVDFELVHAYSKQLDRLARSSGRLPVQAFPFTCIGSVLAPLSPAVAQVVGHRNPLQAHTEATVHAFTRIETATNALGGDASDRSISAVRMDCLASRPIFLKAVQVDVRATAGLVAQTRQSNPQKAWPSVPATATLPVELLRPRWARLRTSIEREYLEEMAIDERTLTQGHGGTRAAYLDLLERTERLDIRQPAHINPDRKTATYVVPFGLYRSGTPKDLAHMQFESHPVWVDCLVHAAAQLTSDAALPPGVGPNAPTVLVVDAAYVLGRPRNPHAIVASEGRVSVYLDAVPTAADVHRSTAPSAASAASAAEARGLGLVELAQGMNAHRPYTQFSGELSRVYRGMMHNAERFFQVCTLLAARMQSHTQSDVYNRSAVLDIETLESMESAPDLRSVAVCVCIGNAMALAATKNSSAQVRLRRARPADAKATARALRLICEGFQKQGIKAVPFSELCMCLSVL